MVGQNSGLNVLLPTQARCTLGRDRHEGVAGGLSTSGLAGVADHSMDGDEPVMVMVMPPAH